MTEHSLTRAYTVLLGDPPSPGPLYLKRQDIDHAFRLQALDIHLERIRNPLASNEEALRSKAQLLHRAYRLLVDVIGKEESVLVTLAEDDREVRTRRPLPKTSKSDQSKAFKEPKAFNAKDLDLNLNQEVKQNLTIANMVEEPLVLGRFLHAQGHITLQELIDAVKWQRAQRATVGEIALDAGYLRRSEVILVLQDQQPQERFCQAAIRLGLMSKGQRDQILERQTGMQKRIGEYFVERGILSREEIDRLAASPLRYKTKTSA